MRKTIWFFVPLLLTLGTVGVAALVRVRAPVGRGISAGVILALIQSLISVGLMRWAWERKFFYYVWGGGIFFRLIVFGITAWAVLKFTSLSFSATLLTLVSATMIFLILEAVTFLDK